MKPIEELNISPWPWSHDVNEDEQCMVYDNEGHEIAQVFASDYDARVLAEAPEMYECLYEAVEDRCRRCKAEWYGKCVTADGKDCEMVAKWKSVLVKSAGEEKSK